jgi:predicted ATPase
LTEQQRPEPSKQIHGFPQPLASLVGRDRELFEIVRQLGDPACRLLTLVGPGGIGKTQLAIQAVVKVPQGMVSAERSRGEAGVSVDALVSSEGVFSDGVYLVWLESLREPQQLPMVVADALHLALSGHEEPLLQLQRHLSDKRLLLVLDNFERVLDGAGIIGDLLQAAPDIKILITSRVALHLREEWLYPVHGLPVPEDGSDPTGYDAVKLFVDRARRVRPGFSLPDEQEGVVRVCQLVEGMPLAIELAAAWTRSLVCAEIATEIERGMDLLCTTLRDVPDRHRSVQTVFDGSWALLTEKEKTSTSAYRYFAVASGEVQPAKLRVPRCRFLQHW